MKSSRISVKNFHADDSFVGRVQKLVREEVIPYQYQVLNDALPGVEKSHAIENIRLAAKKLRGEDIGAEDFYGFIFQDSDVAKWIEAAAYAAHIHHFIKTQPKGYDMEINEEASNISAGQKQLLTIARAFLADAPILILDEATSSVDTRTEALIQKAMANLMHGRTSFIIAHRLSTIKDADHILVMDHGDIIEQGSHEELLARGGVYEKLYNSQFAK